jgi:ACR3 family arsenite efflux pump ArsB
MAAKVTSFIQSNYSYLVFAMVILGVAVGVTAPKSVQVLKPYMPPLISIMVWAMCVTIRFRELILVTKKVKQIVCGLIMNFVFLPLLCLLLAALFLSHNPQWAVGFILMGTVPCAGMNVVWTGLLKGDVPLALILAALTMVLGIVSIPGLTALLAGAYVEVSVIEMLRTIAIVLAIPLTLGIACKNHLRSQSQGFDEISTSLSLHLSNSRHDPYVHHASHKCSFNTTKPHINPLTNNPPLILFPVAFGGAHLICTKVLKCPMKETNAIVYSSGMKHLPLAMGVAFASFGQTAALPIAVSAAFQTVNASIFYRLFQKSNAT